ncbi:hypothetical protein ZPR_4123 [Zunongwangia profunda SM-A87]|mgnify:CR=1 FL=1|jgi:type I restriction enzyme S subunit|uniref:Restriction endonuclease subunit S n=1 Tax=Zunongwangia profunda (strain DSM 18752 / CCTCC AB 206139 / SM-A87) TaxID=655815 RepID=D5BAA1_ZUNPS|nr:hypothetical protein [Zunongwangia profunda]ADF54427.1 hypothetical protein ZPR_4123 [Zunongwangia profunda SM-A87]
MKTYPAYKDSGVDWLGKIPKHWEIRRLGSRFKERIKYQILITLLYQ